MPLRIEIQEFALACEKLARFAYLVNGLTDEEREVMLMCTRALELEAIPPDLRPSQGVPLATPLSNVRGIAEPPPHKTTLHMVSVSSNETPSDIETRPPMRRDARG